MSEGVKRWSCECIDHWTGVKHCNQYPLCEQAEAEIAGEHHYISLWTDKLNASRKRLAQLLQAKLEAKND